MADRTAIASMSLGSFGVHDLSTKLAQAHKAGFKGIELFFEDLQALAAHISGISDADGASISREHYVAAAESIRRMCVDNKLEIIALQPFRNYEGLKKRSEHEAKLEELDLWFVVAKILHTDTIGVPSTFLPADQLTDKYDDLVADLRELAERGAQEDPVIRFGYESLAWGTHADTWEDSWSIVKAVDRPNFGVILDTFNIAAKVYADPTSNDGKAEHADEKLRASIRKLPKEIDVSKIFSVQLVDGERLKKPLVEGHAFYAKDQPSRMSWSRNCRVPYGEKEGYLPVREIAETIRNDLGYEGWWSVEVFNRCTSDENPLMPKILAERGMASLEHLEEDLDFKLKKAEDRNKEGTEEEVKSPGEQMRNEESGTKEKSKTDLDVCVRTNGGRIRLAVSRNNSQLSIRSVAVA